MIKKKYDVFFRAQNKIGPYPSIFYKVDTIRDTSDAVMQYSMAANQSSEKLDPKLFFVCAETYYSPVGKDFEKSTVGFVVYDLTKKGQERKMSRQIELISDAIRHSQSARAVFSLKDIVHNEMAWHDATAIGVIA